MKITYLKGCSTVDSIFVQYMAFFIPTAVAFCFVEEIHADFGT
jgi:hypothetical protein